MSDTERIQEQPEAPSPSPDLAARAPWSGLEILLVVLIYLLWPGVVAELLTASGFFRHCYGEELVALAVQPEEHPLQQLAEQGLTPAEWALWLFAACVAAPILEELLFRGVLQPWFGKSAAHAWGAVILALLVAASLRAESIRDAWPHGG